MKFETKISGTKVTDFGEIIPIFKEQVVTLYECMMKIQEQEVMDFILDNFRFYKGHACDGDWFTTMDWDTIMKITIADNVDYLEERHELENYFGPNWMKQYIRFNH